MALDRIFLLKSYPEFTFSNEKMILELVFSRNVVAPAFRAALFTAPSVLVDGCGVGVGAQLHVCPLFSCTCCQLSDFPFPACTQLVKQQS